MSACVAGGCDLFKSFRALPGEVLSWPAAEYPLEARPDPNKDQEVAVAVFVTFAAGTDFAFAGSEPKLATALVSNLNDLARSAHKKLKVVDPASENAMDPNNPDWRLTYTGDWNKKCWVDYVITVRMERLELYSPGSKNRFYEGKAVVTVQMDELIDHKPTPKYRYVLPFQYPQAGTIDANEVPVTRYKQDFLDRLALELAQKHVKHPATPAGGVTQASAAH